MAVGILGVTGSFSKGDALTIVNQNHQRLAVGLSNYNHQELSKIQGHHSAEIEQILGYSHGDTVIHRSHLAYVDH